MEIEDVIVQSIFPYKTTKNVLIFGGHNSWLTKMKYYVPNANYSEIINNKAISNADIICIQNNCISHSDYYNIMTKAKNNNTEVMYFNFASAKKCALQLYMKMEGQ